MVLKGRGVEGGFTGQRGGGEGGGFTWGSQKTVLGGFQGRFTGIERRFTREEGRDRVQKDSGKVFKGYGMR